MAWSPSRVALGKTWFAASGRAEEAVTEAALNCWGLNWSRKPWSSHEDVTVSTVSSLVGWHAQVTVPQGQARGGSLKATGYLVYRVAGMLAGISASPGKVAAWLDGSLFPVITRSSSLLALLPSLFMTCFTQIPSELAGGHAPFCKPVIWNMDLSAKILGFPGGASGKESSCQWRRRKRCGFDPWVRKIPWRSARQPTPVFLPGESPWTEEPGGL